MISYMKFNKIFTIQTTDLGKNYLKNVNAKIKFKFKIPHSSK